MLTYLVGGAVRDKLLGRIPTERDWVVVGATPAQMLAQGFQQVGKDFPVFLHPQTREEYALARTERKNGLGYTGFVCDSSAHVTLEQDLLRRDLTVNAIAMDAKGNLIDPYGGQQDLQNKRLRHVSAAFIEDPLRVLRVARFAARYHHLGFTVASETLALMRDISHSGELAQLSAERVWKETSRALLEDHPEIYFETLRACESMQPWFAEIDALWGVPNPPKWHPEIDTGVHTMMVLAKAAQYSEDLPVRYAALVHDLGKALTDPNQWPSHQGHEMLGITAVEALSSRLKAPNDCRQLAALVCQYHSHIHKALELKASTVLKVLNNCDAWRKPERFRQILICCIADSRGRTHFEQADYPQSEYFWQAYIAASEVEVKAIVEAGFKGKEIKQQLDKQRIAEIQQVKQQFCS